MGHTVQETNDNCTVSKCSMITQGYFRDEYIQLMTPKAKRRCPLINIGYYVRAVVVEEGLTLFLQEMNDVECQIVSLGAGFDTAYFRLVSKYRNVTYFEVDLEDVVSHKIKRVKESDALFKELDNLKEHPNGLISDNYCLIAQDINNVAKLKEALYEVGLTPFKPTLFLSECAITYMEEKRSRDIVEWSSCFNDVVILIYEQIYPDDGFSQGMLKHYDNLHLPLWSVEVYRTKKDQVNRLLSCGYESAWSTGAFELYKSILTSEDHERVINLEPFDEWEEWHLTSSHYTLSIGTKGLFSSLFSSFMSRYNEDHATAAFTSCDWELVQNVNLQFFGHCSIEIWKSTAVLVVGGFGLQDNKHMRLSQLCLIYLPDMKVTYLPTPTIEGLNWDCIHHTCSLLTDSKDSSEFLLFGGRKSPLKSTNTTAFRINISRYHDEILITGKKITSGKSRPDPRRRHTSTKVGNLTFVFGGIWTDSETRKQRIFDDAWVLTEDENWLLLDKKPSPRFSHSAASLNGMVYIVGGIGNKETNYSVLNDIWTYNVADNVWGQIDIGIIPRYSHTCHTMNNYLLLIGGVNELSEKQPGLTIIDFKSNSAYEFKLPGSSRSNPIMLHNHTSLLSNKKTILVIGGGGHCFSFGTYFNKHPISIRIPDVTISDVR